MTPPLPPINESLEKLEIGTNDGTDNKENGEKPVKCSVPSMLSTHPLVGKWMLWHLNGDSDEPWEQRLRPVARITSVEQFWALYNFVQPASSLSASSDYYFFRDGIRPMWEDASNILGGRWQLKLHPKESLQAGRDKNIDWYWREILMAMIGDWLPHTGSHICGVVANIRPRIDRLAMWTRDAQAESANMQLGEAMASVLRLPAEAKMSYEAHSPKTLGRRGGVMYWVSGNSAEKQ